MSRAARDYGARSDEKFAGVQVDWLDPGFYKIRSRARGHWIPIEIWFEDGDRDPKTWELLSDQKLRAKWHPQTDSAQGFDIDPRWFFNRARPITKEEYEWLLAIRTIRR